MEEKWRKGAKKVQKYDKIKGAKTGAGSEKPRNMGVKSDVLPRGSGAVKHGRIFPAIWGQAAQGHSLGTVSGYHAMEIHREGVQTESE